MMLALSRIARRTLPELVLFGASIVLSAWLAGGDALARAGLAMLLGSLAAGAGVLVLAKSGELQLAW
ncbi:MAG: hypothetical protein ACK4N5_24855, partial [Myxococcales bacterium]